MGYIMEVVTNSGIIVPEAYVRVAKLNGNTESMEALVLFYANKQARIEGTIHFQSETFNFPVSTADSAPNNFKQFYQWGRTIETFANAIDDIEVSDT